MRHLSGFATNRDLTKINGIRLVCCSELLQIQPEIKRGREAVSMKRSLRAVRIFLVWLFVFFLLGMLYAARRGFEFSQKSACSFPYWLP